MRRFAFAVLLVACLGGSHTASPTMTASDGSAPIVASLPVLTWAGDLAGSNYQTQQVAGLQGKPLDTTSFGAPSDAQMPIWDNGAGKWKAVSLSGAVTITAAGVVSAGLSPFVSYGLYSARPLSSNIPVGGRYVSSDGFEFVNTGSAWKPLVNHVAGTEGFPGNSTTGWTSTGAIAATTSVVSGTMQLVRSSAGAASISIFQKVKTAGQSIIAHVQALQVPSSGFAGVCVGDSVSGKLICIDVSPTLVALNDWTNYTTFSAGPATTTLVSPSTSGIWLKIVDTGVSLQFSWSQDGIFWTLLLTDAVTFLGAGNFGNLYGIAINPQAGGVTAIFRSVFTG